MRPVTPASRLAELVRKYTPEIARAFASARRKMRALVSRGHELVYDPNSLLQRVGSRVRSIKLKSPDDIDRADINQLITHALAPHVARFRDCPRLQLRVKSTASKRRSRRPPQGQSSKASTLRESEAPLR